MALLLALLVSFWVVVAHAEVAPGFEPTVELLPPEGASGSHPYDPGRVTLPESGLYPNGSGGWGLTPSGTESRDTGTGLFGGGAFGGKPETESGGFRSWLVDRLVGLGKGLAAGLVGAAAAVLVAALFVSSTPVLLAIGGAALLGGALYGLFVGGRGFNWTEAIVGSVLSGASAGVGWWLSAAVRPLAAKIGVVVAEVAVGGISSLTSYLVHSPERSWRGALWAFSLGGLSSAFFTGAGAVASRVWTWGRHSLKVLPQRQADAKTMVAAALADDRPRPALIRRIIGATQGRKSMVRTVATPRRRVVSTQRLVPGTPEHKEMAWRRYQARGGKWTYKRWSKQYDVNIDNARRGLQRERVYRIHYGGQNRVLKIQLPDGTIIRRQVDIFIPHENRAIQLKTGKQYLDKKNRDAIRRDAILVRFKYKVEWILEDGGSEPLIEALREAGITVRIGPQIPP